MALIQPFGESIEVIEDEMTQVYYIIDTVTDDVKGPITKEQFLAEEIVSRIELKDLKSYEKQY